MFELIAATHTPLRENGDLNLHQIAVQAAHLKSAGVHGVLVAGSTGEGQSLTTPERRAGVSCKRTSRWFGSQWS